MCLNLRANEDNAQELKVGSVPSIINSHFNPSWPVKIYHGGWSSDCVSQQTASSLKKGNFVSVYHSFQMNLLSQINLCFYLQKYMLKNI